MISQKADKIDDESVSTAGGSDAWSARANSARLTSSASATNAQETDTERGDWDEQRHQTLDDQEDTARWEEKPRVVITRPARDQRSRLARSADRADLDGRGTESQSGEDAWRNNLDGLWLPKETDAQWRR